MMRDMKKKRKKRDGLGASEECYGVKKVNSLLERLDRDGNRRKARRQKKKWSQAADEIF
jgi:uncharacterized small protein (DUF1192 family)